LPNVDLTVLFATHNGERVVGRTLEGYCNIESSKNDWKLVVVDNGSTDSTSTIIDSFKPRLPLEHLHEPILGKNRALNAGLSKIEGNILVLTDDDAIPSPTLFKAWKNVFENKPEVELFGGSIKPLFEAPPPKWLTENEFFYDVLFSARDLPDGPIDAAAIYGPNMAVRTSVFDRGFRFNENIGPNGSNPHYPMGSETEFCRKLEQSGVMAWNAKEPLVQHIIRAHQVEEAYWIKRAYRHGRGVARQKWEIGKVSIDRLPRPHLVRLLSRLRNELRMLSPSPEMKFKGLFSYHSSRGFADECAKIRTSTLH
jgi:glucosyl-dolichyl phosphate glucuronosyltransferase